MQSNGRGVFLLTLVDQKKKCMQRSERSRQFWNRFLTKKNQIIDYPDVEAIVAFKHNIRDEWLARQLGQDKPRTMAALTSLMTRRSDSGTSEACEGNGKSRCNRNKCRNNNALPSTNYMALSKPCGRVVDTVCVGWLPVALYGVLSSTPVRH